MYVYSDSKRMFHATYTSCFPAESRCERRWGTICGLECKNIFRHVGFLTYTALCAYMQSQHLMGHKWHIQIVLKWNVTDSHIFAFYGDARPTICPRYGRIISSDRVDGGLENGRDLEQTVFRCYRFLGAAPGLNYEVVTLNHPVG